jgi:hypothetical protein
MRRAMEAQMGRVIELFMERHGPGGADAAAGAPDGEMDGAEIARLARAPAARGSEEEVEAEEEVEEEGEDGDDDRGDDDGMEGDDDGISDEEAGLGYRSELLRESEAELLQLLHGEVDDGGLATGGAAVDSHLTMLMNEGESEFGSDSEDEDEIGAEAEVDLGGSYGGEAPASTCEYHSRAGWRMIGLHVGGRPSDACARTASELKCALEGLVDSLFGPVEKRWVEVRCAAALAGRAAQGLAVLLVEQRMEAILTMADHAVFIENGRKAGGVLVHW